MRSDHRYDQFNDEQYKAIVASAKEDLLISAGAGSGKTKTLSIRVQRLVEDGEIDPASLLILTFTNNAAHEMKERIIATFEKDNPAMALKMNSAHIQTFDSFSQYLVTTYAGRLGISTSIQVADETVIELKRNEFLENIFEEYYGDPEKAEKLFKTLVKFNAKDDSMSKRVILDIDRQLGKILPSKRAAFIRDYEQRFLDKAKIKEWFGQFILTRKTKLINAIKEANFVSKYCHGDFSQKDMDRAFELAKYNIEGAYLGMVFDGEKEDKTQDFYEKVYLPVLEKDGIEFIQTIKTFVETNVANCGKGKSIGVASYKILFSAFAELKKEAIVFPSTYEEVEEKVLSFKDDIAIYFEIIEEMNRRLDEYKKATNRFTFSDIGALALRLLTEEQFADIAEELRHRFKYIMVDEYQDTNDFQEEFINALIKPNKEGERAYLFCVGDAKQSIYAFRNSNVELFRKRQADLGQRVIAMNKNYRSGAKLLDDINYLFFHYMSLEHGSIDYTLQEEELQYDPKVNLYGEPYEDFGVARILPSLDEYLPLGNYADWEIEAIIKDIQTKVESKFKVYDRGSNPHIRPCKYSDFVILTRTKSSFLKIQKRFNEVDIPLNVSTEASLAEFDAIIALQSLLAAVKWFTFGGIPETIRHIYASLARSYLFRDEEHKDQHIHDLLYLEENDDKEAKLEALLKDPILVSLKEFSKANEGKALKEIFIALIEKYGVVEKLPHLGLVADNVAKIEAAYQLVLSMESAGEGLNEFVGIFKKVKNYNLSMKAKTEISVENAVDLMSIHASKGLERKIVYLPASQSGLSSGNNMGKPDYIFSEDFGILLPDYKVDLYQERSRDNLPALLYREQMGERDFDVDEHVRLFYVAFTRAENIFYIVGPRPGKKKESVYSIYDSLPHFTEMNSKFVDNMEKAGVLDKEEYRKYLEYSELYQNLKLPLGRDDFGHDEDYRLYLDWAKKYYEGRIIEIRDSYLNHIVGAIGGYFLGKIGSGKTMDFDLMAKVYAKENYPSTPINGFNDLVAFIGAKNHLDDNKAKTEISNLLTEDCANKNKIFADKGKLKDKLKILNSLAKTFGDYDYVLRNVYDSSSFKDNAIVMDVSLEGESKAKGVAKIDEVAINEEEIPFEVRVHARASKSSPVDLDEDTKAKMAYGTYLHRLMELLDFNTKDTSYIVNPKDRAIVDKVLALPIFSHLEGTTLYSEYAYFDSSRQNYGFIDLLMVKDGIYSIIDYKTEDIDDEAYINQLNIYKENIVSVFGVDQSKVKTYLLSLLNATIKEI